MKERFRQAIGNTLKHDLVRIDSHHGLVQGKARHCRCFHANRLRAGANHDHLHGVEEKPLKR